MSGLSSKRAQGEHHRTILKVKYSASSQWIVSVDLKDAYLYQWYSHHQFLTVDVAGRVPLPFSTTAWPVADPPSLHEDSGSSYRRLRLPGVQWYAIWMTS